MTSSHVTKSELREVPGSEDVERSSTPTTTNEIEADNLKRKESDWNKAEGSPRVKIPKTSELDSSSNTKNAVEENKMLETSTKPKRKSKTRLTRPSHRVPWKQYMVRTYNKAIFDFGKLTKNRKKQALKMEKQKKPKCTSECRCEEKLKKVKETLNSQEFESRLNQLTLQQKEYVGILMENMNKKLHGEKFTMEEKLKCLSIYKKSLNIYEYLSTFLILPKVTTLKKTMRTVYFNTGITAAMMDRMKEVAKKKSKTDKVVLLMFGNVSLEPHIDYNVKLDKFVGFEDWGANNRTNQFASYALVFIIRGLDSEWTLPVAYSFYGEIKVSKLVKMYKEVVSAVKEAGFNIVASICDQEDSNKAAIEKLRTTTLQKRRPDAENRGTILVHDVEIIPLFNPPCLLTEFRNTLFSKDLEFCVDSHERPPKWDHKRELHIKNNKQKLIASWRHIELAYGIDVSSNESCRKMPLLTDKHVFHKELNKSEVKFVTDVLSGSVSKNLDVLSLDQRNIKTSVGEVQMPPEGYYTAYIVTFFKKLFDVMDGEKKDDQKKNVFTNNFHYVFFEAAKEELRHMRFIDRETQKPVDERIPCLQNLLATVEGFQILWKKIKQLGFQFLRTGDFNLDPLEGFSSKNAELTCNQFSRNFKNFCYLDLTI